MIEQAPSSTAPNAGGSQSSGEMIVAEGNTCREPQRENAPPAQPRLAPLEVEDLTDEMRQFLLHMFQLGTALVGGDERKEATGYKPTASDLQQRDLAPLVANMPEILRTMLHHPKLFASLADVGIQLLAGGALSPRERELAILRIGWLCQAPYQWGEHVLIARKLGFTSEEIERVTQGSQAAGWSEHEEAILRATDELFGGAMISDATWEVLSRRFNSRQLIELPVVVGQYQAAAYYQNSLRLRLLNGNLGLEAR